MSATQPETTASPRPKRRRSPRLQRKQTRLAWLMLTPALVVMALVAFYPLGQTVYDSFTDRQFLGGLEPTRWVGLDNYRDLIHDTIFRDAVVVTVKFTVITVSIELVLGLIIALVVNSGFKGRGVMRAVMLVPWAITDRGRGADVEVDVRRRLRRRQRLPRPPPHHRPALWRGSRSSRLRPSRRSTSGRRRRSSPCSCSQGFR